MCWRWETSELPHFQTGLIHCWCFVNPDEPIPCLQRRKLVAVAAVASQAPSWRDRVGLVAFVVVAVERQKVLGKHQSSVARKVVRHPKHHHSSARPSDPKRTSVVSQHPGTEAVWQRKS